MKSFVKIFIAFLIPFIYFSCGKEAATLNPSQVNTGYVNTSSGTVNLQVQALYPSGADVAVDTDIVIVFTKGVDSSTINSTNIALTQGGTPVSYTFSPAVADGDRIIHLNPDSDLAGSTTYDVYVSTSVMAYDGQSLDAAGSTSFTTIDTASATAATAPAVLAATRTPIGNSPLVSINAGYVEVTFSASMNASTITSSTFTIGSIGSGEPYVVDANNKVFRRNISTAAYNTTYTVNLVYASIQSSAGLTLGSANTSWTFTTEADDGSATTSDLITSIWVTDITDTSITVNWQTSDPATSTVEWGTGTDYGSSYTETVGTTIHSYTISVSGATKYYFSITTSGGTETGYVFTKETTTDDTALSTGTSDRSSMSLAMDSTSLGVLNGNTCVLWLQGTSTVTASYLTGATETWESAVDANSRTSPRIFSDGRGYFVVTMQNGTTLYAKMIYNSGTAIGFQGGAWGSSASDTGLSVGTGTNAGVSVIWGDQGNTNVDGGSVSEVIASGTAVVLSGNYWFYDFSNDFSTAGVAVGDTVNGLTNTVQNNPATTYKYGIRQLSSVVTEGDSYSIWNSVPAIITSGTADTVPSAMLLHNGALDFTSVALNDYVWNMTDGSHARVSVDDDYVAMVELDNNIFMTDGHAFKILRFSPNATDTYIYAAESDTSGTANQLNDSSVSFYTLGVKKGDLVYNVTTGNYAVVTVTAASGTPDTLYLNKSIFSSGDKYIVFRVIDASGNDERLTESGTNNSGTGNSTLIDSNAVFNYASSPVYTGDVVHVRAAGTDLLVTGITSATTLTLSGNIAANARYSILQPRALIVYQNSGIYAKMYRLRDGSQYGTTITIDSLASTFPQSVADTSTGGAFVFYERGSVIHGAFVDGNGDSTSIVTTFGGAYLVKVIDDGAGNAYVLSEDGTNVYLAKVSSSAVTWTRTAGAGIDSDMVLDSSGRPIVVYSSSGDIYVRKYTTAGGDVYTAKPVLASLGTYVVNSDSRKSNISIVSDGSDSAIISWIDNRYYDPSGYTIHAQAVNASGVMQWDSDTGTATDFNGLLVGFTSEYRSDKIALSSSIYGAVSYDPIFFWFDFRNSTYTDIYYDDNLSY